MEFTADVREWSEEVFGRCHLGDPRRTSRLIDIGARLAAEPSGSINRVCGKDLAAREGAYKLIENSAVRVEDVLEGVFASTVKSWDATNVTLVIQDTTSISLSHSVADELRENGSSSGFYAHSSLLVDFATSTPIGLVDQSIWVRAPKPARAGAATRRKRNYMDKESYKWVESFHRARHRLKRMDNVITVCDREADIFEFLSTQQELGCRFVVRLSHNRALQDQADYLHDAIAKFPVVGHRNVFISQRGGQKASHLQAARNAREAREAITSIAAGEVTIKPPRSTRTKGLSPIKVHVIHVFEPDPPEGKPAVSWMLFSSEAVTDAADANRIVDMYATRWTIEEFHKAWKSGCKIEERKLQSLETVERMLAITAPVAVRIMQLKYLGESTPADSCEKILSAIEWRCLWAIFEEKPLPENTPTLGWAYNALARTVGWNDSKGTGKAGWQTLWAGWQKLQDRLVGWKAAMATMAIIAP